MKKNKKLIIISLVIVAVLIIAYFVFFKKKAAVATTTKGNEEIEKTKNTMKGSTQPKNDEFPIKKGSQSEKVRLIQKFINLNTKPPITLIMEDGVFGQETEYALLRVTGKGEVTEADLNSFLNKIPIGLNPIKNIFTNGL